jgi:hypothetical protein
LLQNKCDCDAKIKVRSCIQHSTVGPHWIIGGVMVNMLASGAVDHGFIGGVMVNMLASGAVDHGFIGGVMVACSSQVQ